MNPMVDGWMGDDWFHHGAFRQQSMAYIYDQEASRESEMKWWTSTFRRLRYVHGGRLRRRTRAGAVDWSKWVSGGKSWSIRPTTLSGATRRWTSCSPPSRSRCRSCWSTACGTRKTSTARRPSTRRSNRRTRTTTGSSSCMGPWHHGQEIGDGSALGALKFGSDTGLFFRKRILRPFLDQYLKDGAPKANVPPVSAFETGRTRWRRSADLASRRVTKRLSMTDAALSWTRARSSASPRPTTGGGSSTNSYRTPPSLCRIRERPILPVGDYGPLTWR